MLTAGYMSSWRKMEVEAQHKDEDGKQWSVAHVTPGATRLKSTSLIHSKHSAVIQLQIITVIMTAGRIQIFPGKTTPQLILDSLLPSSRLLPEPSQNCGTRPEFPDYRYKKMARPQLATPGQSLRSPR